VAVDQLQAAVGQLVGQQAAGEADLVVQGAQGVALEVGVQAEVQLVGDQVAGADAAVGLDAVADRHGEDSKRVAHEGPRRKTQALGCSKRMTATALRFGRAIARLPRP
jgi:hypothetical protein